MERVKLETKEKNTFIGAWKTDDFQLMDELINFFEENPDLHNDGVSDFDNVNKNYKDTTDICIAPNNLKEDKYKIFGGYIKHLKECYDDYCRQWEFFGTRISKIYIGNFNLQKYDIGGHVNAWHTERDNIFSSHRILAWITYLNDVEEKGETEFLYYGIKVKPEKGKTLIWPSEWTHAHRGIATTKSLKYIITGWFHFPDRK